MVTHKKPVVLIGNAQNRRRITIHLARQLYGGSFLTLNIVSDPDVNNGNDINAKNAF